MNQKSIRLSLMMFLQFFIWGAFFVPLGGYLNQLFSGQNVVGYLYSTSNWAGLIAPLAVGLVADRFFNAERINGVLHLIGACLLWHCASITDSPDRLFRWLLAYFLCYMPTLALVNTITFRNVSDANREFPRIRLWGTIGWIVAGLVVAESWFGLLDLPVLPGIENAGSSAFPLRLAAVASLIYGAYSFTLPQTPPHSRGTAIHLGKLLGMDALRLLRDPAFAIFALCSFLVCIPLAFYYAMTYPFMEQVAFGDRSAAVMALGQVSEIVFMALVPWFFRRLGVKWMLLAGMTAWALRYLLFSLLPGSPVMLVSAILLHGICYDFFFVTGQIYTDRKAPRELRASAQGLIGVLTYGAGMLVGNQVLDAWARHTRLVTSSRDGWLAGAAPFWMLPAGIALAVAIIFACSFRDRSADTPPDEAN